MIRTIQRIQKGHQQTADLAYWLSQPMAERMAAVEALRSQAPMAGDLPDAEPRLQRVCRVTQRKGR